MHRGALLHSSHGTHRFPHGARRQRPNHQRAGEETAAGSFSEYNTLLLFLTNRAALRCSTHPLIQTFTPGAACLSPPGPASGHLYNNEEAPPPPCSARRWYNPVQSVCVKRNTFTLTETVNTHTVKATHTLIHTNDAMLCIEAGGLWLNISMDVCPHV